MRHPRNNSYSILVLALLFLVVGIVLLFKNIPGIVPAYPATYVPNAFRFYLETASVTTEHAAGFFGLVVGAILFWFYFRVRNNGENVERMPFVQIFLTDKKGSWRFAFYTFETIVVGMPVRMGYLIFDSRCEYPCFYIIWSAARAALLIVCIVIRPTLPIHAWIGFLTLIFLFLILPLVFTPLY